MDSLPFDTKFLIIVMWVSVTGCVSGWFTWYRSFDKNVVIYSWQIIFRLIKTVLAKRARIIARQHEATSCDDEDKKELKPRLHSKMVSFSSY